jgi:soluble lytic murein transglycosylase-like protein
MRSTLCSALVLTSLALAGTASAGGIYKYTEKDGTVVYTNVRPRGVKARRVKGSFHKAPRPDDGKPVRAVWSAAYDEALEKACAKYNVPVALARAVMQVESNFDPHAVSEKGALGLMQLMPGTASEMYVRDALSAKDNIEGGVRYLRVLANTFDGDMVKMVAAYNAGPDSVRKYGGKVPPFPETQAYVRKVIALYFQFKDKPKVAERDR